MRIGYLRRYKKKDGSPDAKHQARIEPVREPCISGAVRG